jgi:pimeloyl-ACP methyl ester carboxylesterase
MPGLILVHGGVAHKDWWDSIAPFLADTRRVVALDLTGMGDSDHRERYSMDTYAREVIAAGETGGAFDAGKPFLVGHSFGGFVSLPEQPCANAFLLDHIARQSLKEATRPDGSSGWTWKFDPKLWDKLHYDRPPPAQLADRLNTRVALFRGQDSLLVTDEIWAFMRETFGEETTMVSIPDAQHHLILDQPIAVAAALEVLTGPGWGV